MKVHLSAKGPATCKAKSTESCPLGAKSEENIHFDSWEAAQSAFEAKLASEHGGSFANGSFAKKKVKLLKVHETQSDPFSLVEDPPYLDDDALVQAKDGTLLIISSNNTFSEYGAYMLGNLTNDAAIGSELHRLDPTKEYQNGSCDSVSFALLESNPDIVAIDELLSEDGTMWHSIARHKDGYYIDSLGKWSEQDLYDYWESVGTREDESEFTFSYNVHEEPGKKANFAPESTLQPLVDYLNTLTK